MEGYINLLIVEIDRTEFFLGTPKEEMNDEELKELKEFEEEDLEELDIVEAEEEDEEKDDAPLYDVEDEESENKGGKKNLSIEEILRNL